MRGHNICFKGVIWKIISKLSLLPLLIWSTDAPSCAVSTGICHLNYVGLSQYIWDLNFILVLSIFSFIFFYDCINMKS